MEKNNGEKNVITMTAGELIDLYDMEIERLNYCNLHKIGNRSNNNGGLHKCKYAQYLLSALNADTVITVEGCRGDGVIRDFCLTNTGSVIECAINALLTHESENGYAKKWFDNDADALNGCMEWEIKASLDSHYKATPAKNKRVVVLVNRSGVSVIKKSCVSQYTDNKGRLPATGLYGNRGHFMIKYLERLFGIEGGFEEI